MKTWTVGMLALGMAATWGVGGGCTDEQLPPVDDGNGGSDGDNCNGALDLAVEVTPSQGAAMAGEDVTATMHVSTTDPCPVSVLVVSSDDETVVPVPKYDQFSEVLSGMTPNLDDTAFVFTGLPDQHATVALHCASEGTATVTFTVTADETTTRSDTIAITCTGIPVSSPTSCLIPQGNETLKGVDDQGKLVDVSDWGAGSAFAGAHHKSGASTTAAFAGHDANNNPCVWTSDGFDPSTAGPTTWTPSCVTTATGQFNAIAEYDASSFVVTGDTGLYLFDGSAFQAGNSPDTAGTVACDGAGNCVAGATNGGILTTSNGIDYASNGGNERLSPLIYCDGAYIAVDIFNGVQIYSTNGSVWNNGDLNAFNVNSLACGNGIVVASAQGTTWYSTDTGKTWTQAADAVGQVAFSAAASTFHGVGHGTYPSVATSTDGDTWTDTDTLGMAGFFNTVDCY